MAKLSKRGTTILCDAIGPRGATLAALRSDCHIIRRRDNGGHYDAGRVKADTTVGAIADIWRRRWPDATVRLYVAADFIPNPAAKQAAATAGAAKREAAWQAELAAARAAESAFNAESDPLPPSAAAYIAESLRKGRRMVDGRCRYVADMAKFHESSSGYLGTAIGARFHLPSGYQHTEALDTMADEVARAVYGSDMRAAMRWHRALNG